MCRLLLTAGLCLIITLLASAISMDQFCVEKTDGNYVNPDNPNTYISCSNGRPYIMPCPADLVFYQDSNRCDYATTEAPTTTAATTAKSTIATTINEFCKGKSDGNYVNPNNPNSYISCSNGLTYIMPCPANLVFYQDSNRCDYATTVAPTTTGV